MRTLRWAVRAQADLARIDGYYRPRDFEFAQRALGQAVTAGEFLCEHPDAGPATRRRGVRKWRVANTPFLLLYRELPDQIRIVRVAHGAQNWQKW